MGVAGIASDKHGGQPRRDLILGRVVKLVGQALANLVDRPPGDLFHLKRERVENPPRLRNQVVEGGIAACDPLADVEVRQLDIKGEEKSPLSGDDKDVL